MLRPGTLSSGDGAGRQVAALSTNVDRPPTTGQQEVSLELQERAARVETGWPDGTQGFPEAEMKSEKVSHTWQEARECWAESGECRTRSKNDARRLVWPGKRG